MPPFIPLKFPPRCRLTGTEIPAPTPSIFTTSPPYFRGGMPHGLKGAADLLCDLTRRNGAEVVEAADRTIV